MERDGWMGRIAFVALPGCVCESRGMTVCVGGKTSPHPRKNLDCSRNPILFGRQQKRHGRPSTPCIQAMANLLLQTDSTLPAEI